VYELDKFKCRTLDITYTCTGIYFITHLIKILGMPRLSRKHPYMYVCMGAINQLLFISFYIR